MSYYAIIIVLQVICVWHLIKTGRPYWWLWLIIFLPVVGCLVYIFTQMLQRGDIDAIGQNLGSMVNPGGRIKELEQKLEFSNSFDNKVALADAYLAVNRTKEAIALYESCLKGVFEDNVHVNMQLMIAYFHDHRFEDVVSLAPRVAGTTEFKKSEAQLILALALEESGKIEEADREFQKMNGKFSDYQARLTYGRFLLRHDRAEDAKGVFDEMSKEASHLSKFELRTNRQWINQAIEERTKLG